MHVTCADAESFQLCIAKCDTDVMYIDDCIEDERKYWQPLPSEHMLRRSCMDLIRNERLNCHTDCEKNLPQQNTSIAYFDKEVRNFPITCCF